MRRSSPNVFAWGPLLLTFLASAATARTAPPLPLVAPSRADLHAHARRCRDILQSSIVDFYLPACVDRANGGYLESLQADRFVPTGEKFLTLQARQLWFFSTLAAVGIRTKESLTAARTGFDFLQARFRDAAHGGYFAKVSDAGRPTDRRKHVYLNAFALYALAAYHRASKDAAALTAAKDLFATLESKCHDKARGGYIEFFHEDWREITDPREPMYIGPPGTKTFNTHLHVLEALTELYRVWPDPLVRRRLAELLVINTLTIRLPRYGCNVDRFTPDWRPIQTAQNLRASYGHDVEAAWLCLDAARALGQPATLLRAWAEGLVGYSLRHGYDRTHGGFYYSGPLGKPADDTKKEWWVQAEALVAMLEMFKLTGQREYYDAFARTLDFVEKHQVAPKGSWWATRKADGSPAGTSRTSMWQGAYHNGRSMLLCARLLDELAAAAAPADTQTSEKEPDKVFLGYVYQRPKKINFNLYTHLCHAFLVADEEGKPRPSKTCPSRQLVADAHKARVKVLLSLGGWGWDKQFTAIVSKPETLERYIKAVMAIVDEHDYDGIDLDWEYPDTKAKVAGFDRLCRRFRKDLDQLGRKKGRHLFQTMAASADPPTLGWLPDKLLLETMDWVNVMTYDYTGAWTSFAGHHSPLFASSKQPGTPRSTELTMKYLLGRGMPANRLAVGLPLYGRGFAVSEPYASTKKAGKGKAPRAGNFSNIEKLIKKDGWTRRWDDETKNPWAIAPDRSAVIGYDDAESLSLRTAWAMKQGLRGVFFWQIAGDLLPDGTNPLQAASRKKWEESLRGAKEGKTSR
jgi:mannose/cellobiose epimerase-like protein (N-acyl-D-glucosamine 2-epimerase family)/spore germination protein YaaH